MKKTNNNDSEIAITNSEISASESTIPRTSNTDFEERLTKIWSDLLGLDDIEINENFLDLGGHSLMANRLTIRINQEFGTTITIRTILTKEMTISEQVSLIEDNLLSQISEDDMEKLLAQLETEKKITI